MPEPRLKHQIVGTQHVYTSPDVPGLYVADSDQERALAAVPSAIEMLQRMNERRAEREHVNQRIAARG